MCWRAGLCTPVCVCVCLSKCIVKFVVAKRAFLLTPSQTQMATAAISPVPLRSFRRCAILILWMRLFLSRARALHFGWHRVRTYTHLLYIHTFVCFIHTYMRTCPDSQICVRMCLYICMVCAQCVCYHYRSGCICCKCATRWCRQRMLTRLKAGIRYLRTHIIL
jgi:hypothetical protein